MGVPQVRQGSLARPHTPIVFPSDPNDVSFGEARIGRHRGEVVGHVRSQKTARRCDETFELPVIQRCNRGERVDAARKQHLRLPDVANTGEDTLIQEHVRDLSRFARSNPFLCLDGIERFSQKIRAETA